VSICEAFTRVAGTYVHPKIKKKRLSLLNSKVYNKRNDVHCVQKIFSDLLLYTNQQLAIVARQLLCGV